MFTLRRVLLMLSFYFVTAFAYLGGAQGLYDVDTRPSRGFMPTSDQLASPLDSIDALSGKLHLKLPLGALPRGRAGSGFDVDLVYDSHLYDLVPRIQPPIPPYTNLRSGQLLVSVTATGGWTYNFDNYRLELEEQVGACEAGAMTHMYRARVALPDGSLHILYLGGQGTAVSYYSGDGFFSIVPDGMVHPCHGVPYLAVSGLLTYFTADGSFLKLEINANGSDYSDKTWKLYFRDGGRVVWNGSDSPSEPFTSVYVYDANSNRIRIVRACSDPPPDGDCSQPYALILDDSDRAVRINYNVTDSGSFDTQKRDTVIAPGPNGDVTWTIDLQLLVVGGDGRKYYWTDAPPVEQALEDLYFRLWVVKYVQLPLASPVPLGQAPPSWNSYEFRYSDNSDEGYGELDYARTPSGAEYSYRYKFEHYLSQYNNQPSAVVLAHKNGVKDRTVDTLHWTYTFDSPNNTVTNPDGGTITYAVYPGDSNNPWQNGLIWRIDEPNGSVRKRIWAQNTPYGLGLAKSPNNAFIQRETVTVGDAFGQPAKTAVKDFVYDKNGNVLVTTEYDWVSYQASTVETGITVKRQTNTIYHVTVSEASSTANDANAYWQPHNSALWPDTSSSRRLDAVMRQTISPDGTTIQAAVEFDYDNAYATGNLTAEKRWDSNKSPGLPTVGGLNAGNSQTLTRSYDGFGNITDVYEPEVRTHISYDSQGNVPIRVDYAYGTNAQRSFQYGWMANGTAITSKTDLDNNLITSFTYDNVGRRLTESEPGLRRTKIIYDDANRKVTTKRDLSYYGDEMLTTLTTYDALGRVSLFQTSDGPPLATAGDGIKVSFSYIEAAGGRRTITSTPYRATSDKTLQWTCTQYDQVGRVTAAAMFTGQAPPTNCETTTNRTGITRTQYDADWTIVTDPALKVRKQRRDALTRVIEVVEDPSVLNYSTLYVYDALDDLDAVIQGAQTRTFVFSSLSRLLSVNNPESGATSYTYYDTGELNTRTDARGVVTTYTYDELHRLRTKTYTNDPQATPTATYTYYLAGSGAPKIGQVQSVKATDPSTQLNIASTQYDSYDALGRVTASTQTIAGYWGALAFKYSYWLNDQLRTIKYPSGRVVNYDVDNVGRTMTSYTDTKVYADLRFATSPYLPYSANGRIAQMKLGNDLWETHDYRTPGTTTKLLLGTTASGSELLQLEYNYHATQNNGNLLSHGIVQSSKNWKQSFAYDGANRLVCATEALNTAPADPCSQGTWRQNFGYDRYGNRWMASAPGLTGIDTHEPSASSNFDPLTNRLYVNNSSYDPAGNQTRYEPWSVSYDAENRIVSMLNTPNPTGGSGTFVYDAEGRRVKKVWTAGGVTNTTYYGYDLFGQLSAEYSTQPPLSMGTVYVHPDLLGSVRMVTGEKTVTSTAPALECYDYLPFGRLLNSGDDARNTGCYPASPDAQITSRLPQKFTGEERDPETRLDFFGARYMSAAEGRFLSADPPLIDQDPSDPQSWNLYTYARNNPLIFIDPTGQDCIYSDEFELNGTVSVAPGDCRRKHGLQVNGSIEVDSISYNPNTKLLQYGFTNENGIGFGYLGLERLRGDELDSRGLAFVTGMAARVDASNEAIELFAAATAAAGLGAGAYPYAAQALNEWALGPAMGRLFFEGKLGYDAATAYALGRTISDPNSPLGYLYEKWGQPLGRFGWQLLSRFWASGASGTVNMFPTFTRSDSFFWKVELPILLTNPYVYRIWH